MEYRILTPAMLNFDSRVVAAGTFYSTPFSLINFKRAEFGVFLDRTANTNLDVSLELCFDRDIGSSPDYYPLPSKAVAAGVVTNTPYIHRWAVATDITGICDFGDGITTEPLCAMYGRLKIVTTAATVDTLRIKGILRAE